MTLNSGYQLFTGEDIDAAIAAARQNNPRTILQVGLDPEMGFLTQYTFDFPYVADNNIAVMLYINGAWQEIADSDFADATNALAGGFVTYWWSGDGNTVTINMYDPVSQRGQVGGARLISYE